mmetsp:Transcript_6829/g.27919  ORF Transcript_6829/g.27919 Transcript_6829/m.27919 type:complete len:430 (+) Transcript_6829:71-1360(+)
MQGMGGVGGGRRAKARARRSVPASHSLLRVVRGHPGEVVYTQDGDRRLRGELNGLDLRHGRLEHALLEIVANDAVHQVEPVPREVLLARLVLRGVMVRPQLGHQVSSILRRVDCQRLGDHQQRLGELRNGQLLARTQRGGQLLEVNRERRLNTTAANAHCVRLERALDDAERIVERAVHLVEHKVVCTAQQHAGGAVCLAALEHEHHVIRHVHLLHDLALAKSLRREGLIALLVSERQQHLRARRLGDAAQILLGHAPGRDHASLHEVLERQVIDALGAQHNVRTRSDDFLDAVAGDGGLTLADALELARIRHQHLHTHSHLGLAKVHVQARNLAALHARGHALRRARDVERVAIDNPALADRAAVRLEHADSVDRVACVALRVHHAHALERIDGKPSEELVVHAEDLRAHRSLGDVDDRVLAKGGGVV